MRVAGVSRAAMVGGRQHARSSASRRAIRSRAERSRAPGELRAGARAGLALEGRARIPRAGSLRRAGPAAHDAGRVARRREHASTRLSDDPYETVQSRRHGSAALAHGRGAVRARVHVGPRRARRVSRRSRDREARQDRHEVAVRRDAQPERAVRAVSAGRAVVVARSHERRARRTSPARSRAAFVNMEDDHPVPERRAYGVAGFTTGEKAAIVYDRFDLWQVNLDGSNSDAPHARPRGLDRLSLRERRAAGSAAAVGAAARRRRAIAPCSLDGEGRTIDTSKPLMLSATGEYNKKSGYATVDGRPAGAAARLAGQAGDGSREGEERRRLPAWRSRRTRSRRTSSSPGRRSPTRSACRTPTRSRATTRGASRC